MKQPLSMMLALFLLTAVSCRKKEEGVPKPEGGPSSVVTPVVPERPVSPLTPMESIKDLDAKVEGYKTGSKLTPEEIEHNRRLKEEIIRGTFDIAELCRLALAGHWEPLSQAERDSFVHLMTSLLERKAIFSKEQIKGEEKPYRIVYREEKFLDPEKKRSQVTTTLYVPSKKIDLNINYHLTKGEKGWSIYDVIVDDASLVENYKFQFDTIIRKNGFSDLVSRMEKKLKEMD